MAHKDRQGLDQIIQAYDEYKVHQDILNYSSSIRYGYRGIDL